MQANRADPAGDLYVFINVDSHSLFEREGDDLLLDLAHWVW